MLPVSQTDLFQAGHLLPYGLLKWVSITRRLPFLSHSELWGLFAGWLLDAHLPPFDLTFCVSATLTYFLTRTFPASLLSLPPALQQLISSHVLGQHPYVIQLSTLVALDPSLVAFIALFHVKKSDMYLFIWDERHMCHSVHGKVRRQLPGVDSFLLCWVPQISLGLHVKWSYSWPILLNCF